MPMTQGTSGFTIEPQWGIIVWKEGAESMNQTLRAGSSAFGRFLPVGEELCKPRIGQGVFEEFLNH